MGHETGTGRPILQDRPDNNEEFITDYFRRIISDILCFYAFANRQCLRRHYVFISSRLSAALVRSFGQILLPRYLMNGLSNLDETYKKWSIAPIDDLIRFWKSKVKGQGHSRPSRWRTHPRQRQLKSIFHLPHVVWLLRCNYVHSLIGAL